jgi:phosphoribosylformylglycinamidine synthase
MTLEPQETGEVVFLLGETYDETGGSEYFRYLGERDARPWNPGAPRPYVGNKVPRLDTALALPLYRVVEQAIREGLVRSAATPARGGWALAFARCAMAGRLGLDLDLDNIGELPDDVFLFSESNARFLITTSGEVAEAFEQRFAGLPCRRVGETTTDSRLRIRRDGRELLDVEIALMTDSFKRTLADA